MNRSLTLIVPDSRGSDCRVRTEFESHTNLMLNPFLPNFMVQFLPFQDDDFGSSEVFENLSTRGLPCNGDWGCGRPRPLRRSTESSKETLRTFFVAPDCLTSPLCCVGVSWFPEVYMSVWRPDEIFSDLLPTSGACPTSCSATEGPCQSDGMYTKRQSKQPVKFPVHGC